MTERAKTTPRPGGVTEAQARLLAHMDAYGPRWFSLVDLDQIRLLEPDDVLVVPSLIERGLVTHMASIRAVALTAAGAALADQIRSEAHARGDRSLP